MAGSRTLKLNILAETKDLVDGLNKAGKETESAGDKIKKGFKIAAAAVAAAGAAIIAFGAKAILAGEQAATANARIEQINKSMGLFGGSVGEVNDRLIKYAEATARATGIDTNSIKATQAKLLTFKELAKSADEVNGSFDRATKAAIDLAAAGFGSAETNAAQLGKALQDPIKGLTALARSGVTFTEVEKERIKTLVESNQVGEAQRLVLEAIEKQVGGTAEATANATDKIRVGFTQVQERIGLALLPAFEKLTNFILEKVFPAFEQKVLPIFQKINDFLQKVFVPFIADVFTNRLGLFKQAWDLLTGTIQDNRKNFEPLLNLLKSVWAFVKDFLAPILNTALVAAFKLIVEAINLVIKGLGFLINALRPVIDLITSLFNGISRVAGFLGLGGGSTPTVSSGFGNITIPGGGSVPTLPTVPTGSLGSTKPAVVNNTVNVNGTVLDPEGTARAVSKVVSRSVDRAGSLPLGGGGGFGLVFQ
jgi:hypothetical protein